VRNVFRLDERQIGSMMIPRAEIAWLDVESTPAEVLAVLREHGFNRYPVCRGGLNEVLGVANAPALLASMLEGQPLDLTAGLEPPLFVPETLSGMELLEHFRVSDAPLVFVVDEYGEVQGVISLQVLATATSGFSKSSSLSPIARNIPRANALRSPLVIASLRRFIELAIHYNRFPQQLG